jgi:hypothetical protein
MIYSRLHQEQRPIGVLPRFRERFGLLQAIFLVLSTLGILAIAPALISLWIYCNGESLPSKTGPWTDLILTNWLLRFITVSSAALRFCVSAQALLACLMLASLALEHQQVRSDDVNMMAVYQYSNGGALDLIWPLTCGMRWGVSVLGLLAALLLAAEGTVVQLSSTILLSDLKPVVLRDTGNITSRINYTFSDSFYAMEEPSTLMKANPVEYPLFAEKATDRIVISDSKDSPGLVDSGSVVRALFPLHATDRSTLAAYRGPARVISTHSVCFAPHFTSIKADFDSSTMFASVNKTIEIYMTGDLDSLTPGNYSRKLMQRASLAFNETDSWEFFRATRMLERDVLNVVPVGGGRARDVAVDFPVKKLTDTNIQWILVAIPTWPDDLELSTISEALAKVENSSQTVSESFNGSEWTTTTFPAVTGDDRPSLEITHSLCAIEYQWGSADIEVKAKKNYTDARLGMERYSGGASVTRYVTSAVQRQLGVDGPTRRSNDERGIVDLSSWTENDDHDVNSFGWAVAAGADGGLMTIKQRSGYGYEFGWLFPVAEALFMNSLADTGQLSLAWETIAMALFDAHYTQNLDFFDVPGNVTMHAFKEFMVPRQYVGLYAVLSVLALHTLIMLLVLSTYFRSLSWEEWVPEDFKYLLGATEKGYKKLPK